MLRAALGIAVECGARSIAEAAQHAGNILQWRVFLAALFERPGGLAFKVDDQKVRLRVQQLAQMIVAVDTNALTEGCGGVYCECPSALQKVAALAKEPRCAVHQIVGDRCKVAFERS